MTKIKSFKNKIFKLVSTDFDRLALELFRFQAEFNPVYRYYIKLLNINPLKINSIYKIPFMPISFYKHHQVISFDSALVRGNYESSGTSGHSQPSRHYYYDEHFYLNNTVRIFQNFYGRLENYHFLALLPGYLERKNSSLIAMVNHFISKSGSAISGFYLYEYEKLIKALELSQRDERRKTILIGVSFALLDLAEKFTVHQPDLVVVETGGMKGKRTEMVREELHGILRGAFGIRQVHSEYGMTELFSQAYSRGNGLFLTPDWMKVILREHNDPFNLDYRTRSGAINVIDLANVDSCAFIATDDLGRLHSDGSLEILGRLDNADMRGCNLLIS